MTRGALRSCAVHGRNFWLAYGGRSFGGRFFCPGYLRDDLFAGFDPAPYRSPVLGEREGDHTVLLIDGGWPTPDTPQCVIERRGGGPAGGPAARDAGRADPAGGAGRVLAAPVRGPEPEPVLVLTLNSQACKVKAMRAKRGGGRVQYVFGWRTLVVGCLAWLFVGLPLVACALGWVLR